MNKRKELSLWVAVGFATGITLTFTTELRVRLLRPGAPPAAITSCEPGQVFPMRPPWLRNSLFGIVGGYLAWCVGSPMRWLVLVSFLFLLHAELLNLVMPQFPAPLRFWSGFLWIGAGLVGAANFHRRARRSFIPLDNAVFSAYFWSWFLGPFLALYSLLRFPYTSVWLQLRGIELMGQEASHQTVSRWSRIYWKCSAWFFVSYFLFCLGAVSLGAIFGIPETILEAAVLIACSILLFCAALVSELHIPYRMILGALGLLLTVVAVILVLKTM